MMAPDTAAARLRFGPVQDIGSLREFLRAYQRELLVPVELPAIHCAWHHATRNEFRELAAFDRALRTEGRLEPFAVASQAAGQRQLRRFRPLTDVRFVQRYLTALERGDVCAWHTVVYGVTIWMYSLPLYQGLLGYARQVTRGFIRSAVDELGLKPSAARALFAESTPSLAAAALQVAHRGAP